MADEEDSPQASLSKLVIARAQDAVDRHRTTLEREREGLAVPEDLTSCSVDLSRLGLTSLPEDLVEIIRDEAVWLALNYNLLTNLSALGPRMADFARLKYLYLRHNNLTEFPREVLDLPNIESLDFRDNRLEYLPDDLNRLSRLKRLSIKENQVSKLPVCIGCMPSLSSVLVSGNPIVFPPLDLWKVDPEKKREDSSVGTSIEVQETQALKRVLADHAKGPKLRVEADTESSDGGPLETTPRPARRQASGRYPIRPSASSIDMSQLTAQASLSRSASSASLSSRPPAIPLSGIRHARIPTAPRSAAVMSAATIRRTGAAGPGNISIDRHRSQSEGQMVTSVREKRKGIVRAKHGSDQSREDEEQTSYNSGRHARGSSYASSTLQSTASTYDGIEEEPAETTTSSLEDSEAMEALRKTQQLGFYWNPAATDRKYDHPYLQAIQYLGDRLYSAKSITLRLVEQFKPFLTGHSPFLPPFLAMYVPLDKIAHRWETLPSVCARFESDTQLADLIEFTTQQFDTVAYGYGEFVSVLGNYMHSIQNRFPDSFLDELLAHCRLMSEAWISSAQRLDVQEMRVSQRFKTSERQRTVREQERASTQLTSLRVRDSSNVPHGRFRKMTNTSTIRPKPPPLRAPDNGGSLSSLNTMPARGYEAYHGTPDTQSVVSSTQLNTPESSQHPFSEPGHVEINDFAGTGSEFPHISNTSQSVHTPSLFQAQHSHTHATSSQLNSTHGLVKLRSRAGPPLLQHTSPMQVKAVGMSEEQIEESLQHLLAVMSFTLDRSLQFLPSTLDQLSNAHRASMIPAQHQTISRCYSLAQETLRATNELKYVLSTMQSVDLYRNRIGTSRSLWDPAYVFLWSGMEFAALCKEAITTGILPDSFRALVGKTNTPLCHLIRAARATPWVDYVERKNIVPMASGAGNGAYGGGATGGRDTVPATPLSAALGPAVSATMPVGYGPGNGAQSGLRGV